MEVILYSSLGWGPCVITKSWLRENNIDYVEKNVENEESKKELLSMGFRSTPVIMVDGTSIVGYNPKKMAEVLVQ